MRHRANRSAAGPGRLALRPLPVLGGKVTYRARQVPWDEALERLLAPNGFVPWDQAIDVLARVNGLDWTRTGDVIRVEAWRRGPSR